MLKFNPHKSNCMGCAACYSACPVKCIVMRPDEEGFLYPESSDACIECKLCEKVCPMNKEKSTSSYHKKAFAAITKDKSIWKRSTSGGAFSEIVRNYADNETLIAGAAWDGFKVHHISVIGFDNIAPLCKSKYISSAIEDTFIEIRNHLRNGKKAIFCGCPCQVDGLKHFLMNDYENLLTIDLICHGQGSPLVFQECMKTLGQELGENVSSYEFRTKRWIIEDEYMSKVVTGKKSHYLVKDYYQQLFLSQDILRPACGDNCRYRNQNRPGDITIADCRGLTQIFPDLIGHKQNYSTVVVNTPKGGNAVSVLTRTMNLREYSIDDVVKYNPLFDHQTLASKNREQFFSDFFKEPQAAIRKSTIPFIRKRVTCTTIVRIILPSFILRLLYKIR